MIPQAEIEFKRINGKRIECRRIGTAGPDQPVLAFLHEGLGSHDMWKDFPDRVAAATGLPALVYSRPGYGRSDPVSLPRTVDFMHDEALVTLPALLDSFAISKTILVGHSDGGSIALIHAAANPAVSGLLLLAPHVFMEEGSIAGAAGLETKFHTDGIPQRLDRYHNDAAHTFKGWINVILHPDFVSWSIVDMLPDIHAPILHIQGKNDEFWSEAQPQTIKAQAGGVVEIVMLENCGHSPHRDQPAQTLAAITGFTDRYLNTTGPGA